MNATTPPAPPPAPANANASVVAGRDRTRLRAVLSAALFVPAALAAGVLALSSQGASRCVTYGEQCTSGLPGSLFLWSVSLGVVALAAALAAPAGRLRQAALAAQLLAECTGLLVILSYA
ncbi:hypothetical protein AB0D29_37530 [Streptomyces sp. NPDC048424]|uniref:hypothetical protein n=1 Tax=Streptomyces sp. NPDC048424 TaxID=3155265 RepID=UPI0034225015